MLKKFKTRVLNFGVRMIKTAFIEVELEKEKLHEEFKYSSENLGKEIQHSEQEGETMKDWWEHAQENKNKVWLTGSSGQEVWKNLEITDKLKVGSKVLNIGVGMGYCTKELAKLGLNVHALDISKKTLDLVKGIAVCWTPDKLYKLPRNYFDLAISNLVAQHMSDKDLIAQIREVCKALKPKGIFAIQFSQNINDKPNLDQSLSTQKGGSVLRTNKEIKNIVKLAGGKILQLWVGPVYPKYQSRWVFVHIGKKN